MFEILYFNQDFLVINKSPDVSVHKDDNQMGLLQKISESFDGKPLYLVHRLDKMTSGLLLLARHGDAASVLSQKFARREMEKYYLALAGNKPKKKQGLISGDMVRSRRSSWKLQNSLNKPAVTQFFSQSAGQGIRAYLCKPYTGKTHQIRVALKSVGAPIFGDPIYNPSDKRDRGYLHAYAMRFEFGNEVYEFTCPPTYGDGAGELWDTENVCRVMEEWRVPWERPWPLLPAMFHHQKNENE